MTSDIAIRSICASYVLKSNEINVKFVLAIFTVKICIAVTSRIVYVSSAISQKSYIFAKYSSRKFAKLALLEMAIVYRLFWVWF